MFTNVKFPSAKRSADLILAASLTVATAPVLLLIVALVKLTSAGPVIYAQTRVGRDRRLFTIFKIRTMYHNCERLSGPQWSTENDPRIIPIGRFLRRAHLDELPQIWNVLRGEMSLVGPRPERPEFIPELEKALPRYAERLGVAPGLTGLAQVNLPPDVDHESVRRKLVYDLHYVDNQNLWLDVRILTCTGLFLAGVPFAFSTRFFGLRPWEYDDEAACRALLEGGPALELASPALSAWPEG